MAIRSNPRIIRPDFRSETPQATRIRLWWAFEAISSSPSDQQTAAILFKVQYLGKFYFDEHNYDKAIDIFRKVMSMTSTDDGIHRQAHSSLSWCYALEGQYEESIREYKNALEYVENKAAVLLNIATTYEKAFDFTNAKIYYSRTVEFYPKTSYADEARMQLKIMGILGY